MSFDLEQGQCVNHKHLSNSKIANALEWKTANALCYKSLSVNPPWEAWANAPQSLTDARCEAISKWNLQTPTLQSCLSIHVMEGSISKPIQVILMTTKSINHENLPYTTATTQ